MRMTIWDGECPKSELNTAEICELDGKVQELARPVRLPRGSSWGVSESLWTERVAPTAPGQGSQVSAPA